MLRKKNFIFCVRAVIYSLMKTGFQDRIRAVRANLRKRQVDCLVITNPANVTYTTGFTGDSSWAIITKSRTHLLTDSRYTEQAQKQCQNAKIIQRTNSLPETLVTLLQKLKQVQSVAVENSISLAGFEALKKKVDFRLKIAEGIIESLRSIKDSGEIAAVRKAAKISAKALKQTRRYVKPGITENEMAGRLDFQIRKSGAANSFETIIAFGPNASRPHHQPGAKKLKKNDTILIDFGVKYKGYCSDITRCFTIGRAAKFYNQVYQAVTQAQTAAITMIKPGIEIKKIDAAARKVIADHNLPLYGHGTGHSLGLEVHEEPVIAANSKGRLKPGMIFTIEPGVYIPGKLGVRIEDDVLVTQTGCRVLSDSCLHWM